MRQKLNLRWLDDEDLVDGVVEGYVVEDIKLSGGTFRHLTMNITSCSSNQYMSGSSSAWIDMFCSLNHIVL